MNQKIVDVRKEIDIFCETNAVKNVLGKAHNVVRNITEQNDVESTTGFGVVGRGLVHVFNQVVYFIIVPNSDLKNDNVAQQKLVANQTHL